MSSTLLLIGVNAAILVLLYRFFVSDIPPAIRRLLELNTTRLDGTRSRRRAKREARHFRQFAKEMVIALLLILLVANSLLVLIHTLVIPIPIAAEAVLLVHPDSAVWRDHLDAEAIANRHVLSFAWGREAARATQRVLWNYWPIVLVAVAAIVAFGVRTFTVYYLAALRELERDARRRFDEYLWRDLLDNTRSGRRGHGKRHAARDPSY